MTKDEKIIYLHQQGFNYDQISAMVGSYPSYARQVVNNSLHSKK